MSATNANKETNCVKEKIVGNTSTLKILIDELSLISLPSSLWGTHVDLEHDFLAFSKIDVGDNSLKATKAVVVLEMDNSLKINVFMDNTVVQIPYISKAVSNIQELNSLLKAVDAVEFCKNYFTNKKNQCLIFKLRCMDVCSKCFSNPTHKNSNNIESTHSKTEQTQYSNDKNKLSDITFCNTYQNDTSATKVNDICCILCEKNFKTKEQLLAHERNHLSTNSNNEFECTICLKKSADVIGNLEHYQNYHKSVKFIKCALCRQRYTNVQQLKKHVRNHRNLNTFICKDCNKCYISKQQLKQHVCILNIKRTKMFKYFLCNICKTKYSTKNLLRQHQKEHQLKKSFRCKGCKKTFDTQDTAAVHKVHCNLKRLKYVCHICDKRFSCISQKICHMKKLHSFQGDDSVAKVAPSSPI